MTDMVVHIMRRMVSDVYDGVGWKRKVELMSDDQVIAIYYKFLDSGKFDARKEKDIDTAGVSTATDDKKNDIFRGEQLSFDNELYGE